MPSSLIKTGVNNRMQGIARLVPFLAALLLLCACSLPRIIVLHDPLSSEEHVRLGSIYASQGETKLARDQFRLAVKADKNNGKAWQLLGDTASQLKEYGDAEDAYEKALDLDPKSGDLHNNLAWLYATQGKRLRKARDLIDKAMSLTPEHRPYYLDTLGVIFLKMGQPREAVMVLRESVNSIPPDQRAMQGQAWLHLSEAYQAVGNAEAAKQALTQGQELSKQP
jgi:Tfp pilus assembly protein PilF